MEEKQINRHEFFRSVGRSTLLLGITGMGAAALHGTREVSECFNFNYCNSCDSHTGCTLPEKKELTDERTQKIREA